MKRPGNINGLLERIAKWRVICPDIAIRSTFIVGFPGETEEDFQILLDFLTEVQLEKVGCFKYSAVDGARANMLGEHISEKLKEDRYHRFMRHQQAISMEKLRAKIGETMDMMVDEVNRKMIIGRSKYDAPEIDGSIYIKNFGQYDNIRVGNIIKVTITGNKDYDLYARPLIN